MLVINQDHYVKMIAHRAGTFVLDEDKIGSRYAMVVSRTLVDTEDPADLKAAHAAQDGLAFAQESTGTFEVPAWDEENLDAIRAVLNELGKFTPTTKGRFGDVGDTELINRLLGTVIGWGGNPPAASNTDSLAYIAIGANSSGLWRSPARSADSVLATALHAGRLSPLAGAGYLASQNPHPIATTASPHRFIFIRTHNRMMQIGYLQFRISNLNFEKRCLVESRPRLELARPEEGNMPRIVKMVVGLTCELTAFLILLSASSQSWSALQQPQCPALKDWAAAINTGDSFDVVPGVTLNSAFANDVITPLFGQSVRKWTRDDFNSLSLWLTNCRREAMSAKDRVSGDTFYAGIKELKAASRSMRTLWNAQTGAERQVDSLTRMRQSADLAAILDMAQQALQGQDVSAQVSQFEPQYQGSARQAADLSQYAPMLSQDTVNSLTAKLEEKKASASAATAARQEQHQALLAEINAVPVTPNAMAQLNRIAYSADVGRMTRKEQASYNQAYRAKQNAINAELQKMQLKAQAEASKPMDLSARLKTLLAGDSLKELSIGGLYPGMSQQEAETLIRTKWHYEPDPTAPLSRKFIGSRDDRALFKQERRNGGQVELEMLENGEVGQVSFEEHYTAMVVDSQPQRILSEQLGAPTVQLGGGGRLLTWKSGDYRLQVFATNQIEVVWRGAGYQSRLALSFWTEEFEDHLEGVNKHCAKLKDKGRNEWSINESHFFGMECNFGLGGGRKPGL
jgi:hypothetical protein